MKKARDSLGLFLGFFLGFFLGYWLAPHRHRAKNEGYRKGLKRRLPRSRAHRVEQLLEGPRLGDQFAFQFPVALIGGFPDFHFLRRQGLPNAVSHFTLLPGCSVRVGFLPFVRVRLLRAGPLLLFRIALPGLVRLWVSP